MSEEIGLAALGIVIACLAYLFREGKNLGERVSKLEQQDVDLKEEQGRLAKNAHDDRNNLSTVSLWIEIIKVKLGIK